MINIFSLPNGLRIAVKHTPDSNVSYIGVAVNAGSRDESAGHQGLAHFVEHTLFKGTDSRRAWHISNRMESIGGELNAYTSKEETLIYTNAPAGEPQRAIELLADIIANSRFPHSEINKEREVVIDEINSYLDSPADSIFDEFEEFAYSGSSLAHNILGSPESVRQLTSADCRHFLDLHYTPGNMVVYVADPSPVNKILHLIERYFGNLHFPTAPSQRTTPPPTEGFNKVIDRKGHQAHTITGRRLFSRTDPRRFALFLLNNYFGGPCMNSRLNRELREKRGLVYTVDSNVALLSDTGLMQVYFGCDISDVDKCLSIINKELAKIASEKLSPRTFENIVNQYCGQLLVSSDNKENMAMSMAKSLMYFNEIHDIRQMTERLRSVTPEELRSVAEFIINSPECRLTIH